MSNVPASVPASIVLADLTTAQLSERMGKLSERYDTLKVAVTDFDAVKGDLSATVNEMQKRLGHVVSAAKSKPSGEKRPRAKKEDGNQKYPSLKEIVQTILSKTADGLDLNGIRVEVDAMIKRGEYASNAKSLSAVISQAVNSLKQEKVINHDRDSKKYSIAA